MCSLEAGNGGQSLQLMGQARQTGLMLGHGQAETIWAVTNQGSPRLFKNLCSREVARRWDIASMPLRWETGGGKTKGEGLFRPGPSLPLPPPAAHLTGCWGSSAEPESP